MYLKSDNEPVQLEVRWVGTRLTDWLVWKLFSAAGGDWGTLAFLYNEAFVGMVYEQTDHHVGALRWFTLTQGTAS